MLVFARSLINLCAQMLVFAPAKLYAGTHQQRGAPPPPCSLGRRAQNFTGPWSCDVGRRNELILVTIMNVCSVTSTHVGQDATHSHDHEVCGFNEHTATSTARLHRWLFWVLVFHDHLPALLADGGSTIARSAGG